MPLQYTSGYSRFRLRFGNARLGESLCQLNDSRISISLLSTSIGNCFIHPLNLAEEPRREVDQLLVLDQGSK